MYIGTYLFMAFIILLALGAVNEKIESRKKARKRIDQAVTFTKKR